MIQSLPEPLTARESTVLDLLCRGLSNKQIARSISVSEQTVKYHLKNLYLKLGAQGRTHAVSIANRGLAETGDAAERPTPERDRERIEIAQSPLAFARRTRRLFGQHEAVVDGEVRLSYAQLFDRCDRWSAALAQLGVRPGDRVAVIAPCTHTHLEQFFAVPQLGAVIVPLNHRLIAEDFAYLVAHCGATVLCATAESQALIDSVRAQLTEVRHFVALDGRREGWLDYEALLEQSDGQYPRAEIGENDLIAINYTSGTCSRPRGVMVTHRNVWLNVVGSLLHWPLHSHDRYLWLLPMAHGNGWSFVWTVTAAAATHVCVRDLDTAKLADLIARERVSTMCAGRTALIAIANCPDELRPGLPRNVRLLTAGASPAAATIERVESELGWDVSHAYGLSETTPFISFCDVQTLPADASAARRARFKARQGTELITSGELRVVDEEGQDVPCDGSTVGEIVVRGGVVMKGYYRDPEATARAFANGWFHTGDAAVMHADGYVEIRDRFKDIIISGDEVVSSIEVEDVLMRHPAVREAIVVGVPHEALGESPLAFVLLKTGARAREDELRDFALERLAAFKVPAYFRCVAELPRTATGKVIKHALRQLANVPATALAAGPELTPLGS